MSLISVSATSAQVQPTDAVALSPTQISLANVAAWDMITQAFTSTKTSERRDAVAALGMIGDAHALSMIETALSDKAPEVRAQAVNTLADLDARSSVPKLKPLLQDKSQEVVFTTARALSLLGDPAGRDVLIEVLTGERHVSGGLVGSGLSLTKDVSPANLLFFGASQGATILVAPYAGIGVTVVRELMSDHDSPARATSAQLLASDSSERAIEILTKALHDKNWAVRGAAAQALGNAPSKESIRDLTPLLKDKKREVRLVTASSIIRLSAPPPPPALSFSGNQ